MSNQLDSNKYKIDHSTLNSSRNYEQDDGMMTDQQIKAIKSMVSQEEFKLVESLFLEST